MQRPLQRTMAKLRANFRRRAIQPQVGIGTECEDDPSWRRDFQRMDEMERAEIANIGANRAYTIGGVVIFGWQQFDSIVAARNAADKPRALQGDYLFRHRATGLETDGDADLVIRWRDAICLQMGLEEYHQFLLARRQRDHDGHFK